MPTPPTNPFGGKTKKRSFLYFCSGLCLFSVYDHHSIGTCTIKVILLIITITKLCCVVNGLGGRKIVPFLEYRWKIVGVPASEASQKKIRPLQIVVYLVNCLYCRRFAIKSAGAKQGLRPRTIESGGRSPPLLPPFSYAYEGWNSRRTLSVH